MDVLTELVDGVACSRFLSLVKPDAAATAEDRSVPIAISSEQPVLAMSPSGKHYMEILDHGPDSIRTERLGNGLPLLVNHDEQQHVGIVLGSAVGDDKVLRGLATFGRSALASEKLQDVRDGILRGASVRARMFKPQAEGAHENGLPVIRFMEWEPLEVSLVPFEADTNAGVMRSAIIPETTQRAAKTKKVAGEELTAGDFAYVGDPDEPDTWKLPIKFDSEAETKKHIQLALDLFSDTEGIPADKKQEVYDRIVAAAKAHGIKTPAENGDKTKRTVEVTPMPEEKAAPTPEALEVQRRAEIQAYAELAPGVVTTADVNLAILSKRSAEEFRQSVVTKMEEKTRTAQVATAGESVWNALNISDKKQYSVQRAYRYAIFKAKGTKIISDDDFTLEKEVSEELEKTTKRAAGGVFVPTVTKTQRANTYTAGDQTQFISTVTSPDVIKYLYNRARLMQLGAKRLAGIQGLLKIPVMGSTSSSNWLAETVAVTPSNPGSTASVEFKPNRLSIQGILTMELLAQTSPDVEAILIADQEEVAALSLDYAGIQGTGTNSQPLGILNTTGVGSIVSSGATLASGGKALAYQDIVDFETKIAAANADSANMGWMLTPEVRGLMKTTPKIGSTFPVFLYPDQNGPRDPNGIEQGPMGYKAGVTNQLPKNLTYDFVAGTPVANLHAAIFGDFSTVIVGDWGTMDVIVDPYTQAGQGEYIITRNGLFDVELRHPQRLSACLTAAVA